MIRAPCLLALVCISHFLVYTQDVLVPLCKSTSNPEAASSVQQQGQTLTIVTAGNGAAAHAGSELVADLFESSVGKSLLRRFDDASEAVRELATSTFLALLQVRGRTAATCILPLDFSGSSVQAVTVIGEHNRVDCCKPGPACTCVSCIWHQEGMHSAIPM